MQDLEHIIRERAYHLWLADGCRDGNADGHWLVAQREVLASSLGAIARVTVAETASPSKGEVKSIHKIKATGASKKKRRAA